MGLLTFNVSVGGKTQLIHMQESVGVDELFRKVSADCTGGVDPQDIELIFGDVLLVYDQNKSFKDYNLVHMSTLTLLVRLHGGANPGSTSLPTPRAARSKPRDVKLSKIRTWVEFYDSDKEVLKKSLQANGEALRKELENKYPLDPEINSKVSLFEGDITTLQVDGIVSSGNCDVTATGGVSSRIRTVAGPDFEKVTKAMKVTRAGGVMATRGFDLPATYVVHTVGPQKEEPKILESCYKNCLEKMTTMLSIKSLAFPCIATGFCEYPREKAVRVALRTVRVWLEEQKDKQQLDQIARIIFCLFTPEDVALYRTWMQVFYPCPQMSGALLPLPGFIETTTTEPDMLGLDESPIRARMPCGHVIGPLSMTDYCRDQLAKGRYRFCCPSNNPKPCNREWEYFLVRHVARLTPEEMQDIEKQISENYLKKAKGMQKCPGCQTWCLRASVTDRCVRCKICTDANGNNFDFCWWCLNPWRASSADKPCGNTGCDGKDARLKVLENCPTKNINNCPDCPSIRGCPKCGILIEHKDKCAHMDCTTCGDYGFCFICLAEKKNGNWQCSPWSSTVKCTLAPRQTTLPGSK